MSTRKHNGSSKQQHQRAAELHDGAAQAHAANEKHNHQTRHERSGQALDHSHTADEHTDQSHHNSLNGNDGIGAAHEDIAILAHGLWEARGCPDGSPDEDWFDAAHQLHVHGEAVAK
jgi:hypothetical protein